MAWYAFGLIAPPSPSSSPTWVTGSSVPRRGDAPVPDLLFVLLTVLMFVVLALMVRGGERL
jgi:hypothetical protein